MRWHDDVDPARVSSVDLLLFSMISNLQKSRDYTKDVEGLRRSELFFDPQPWPIYISQEGREIDFASVVKLKSDTEKDRRSENLGNR